jgi:hypothetical protein
MRHTPGPWHRNIKPATKYPTIFAGRNTHVAYLKVAGLSEEEVEGNCDLIAAAPAMLEALEWALQYVRMPDGVDPEAFAAEYNKAHTAIAKAKGGAP